MNTNYFSYQLLLVLALLLFYNAHSQTIATYNFETGLQGWSDGGYDSGVNYDNIYASGGTRSIYSKDNDTNQNYTTSPVLNLSTYSSIDFSFSFIGHQRLDIGEGFSLQYYNGTSWSTIKTYALGTDFVSVNRIYTFYHTISTGLSANSQFRFTSTTSDDNEYCYFDDVLIKVSEPEIDVTGNGLIISNGDITPSDSDHTAYGTSNFGSSAIRTFTIYNKGGTDLTISDISLSNTTDFSIIAPFYTSPVIPSTGSTTFTVQFNAPTMGLKTTTVTITSNDSDEASFQFDIQARSEQNFFDSDNDGVLDNIDIDDDNDGIPDLDEESTCSTSSVGITTNYKYLNETFGQGDRTTINTTYDTDTRYCYENGFYGTSEVTCPDLNDRDLNDGEYVVYYRTGDGDGINDTPDGEIAGWADGYWYLGEDHTPGDTKGRMAMFNASFEPGTFYTATIVGALPNVPITYSFWVLNLDTATSPGIENKLRPNILVEFRDANENLLTSITTGDIPPSVNGDPDASWHNFTASVTFNVSEFKVYFINNEIGGLGNDLALDDIVISQTLCDTDGDGVANIYDLDSDNDGIPDVVENGLGNYSEGNATLTNSSSWVDSNNNGMLDFSEGRTIPDSDGDGTPNHLDLDSDNDAIFDVDESGAGNTANIAYQNGDGDINGDGVGDGTDTDAVRETDIDSDGSIELYPDGILDSYDFFNGSTYATAYGNSNQGAAGPGWKDYVVDTDNDNIPDYLDVTSNGATFDISNTLYANLDANSDGIIDDTNDTDGDGIVDLFDTNDASFGSPRDISGNLQLFFDGRNDYAAESTVINRWGETTIMTWIKIDPAAAGMQTIVGQDVFYLRLNADKSITALAGGNSITNGTPLNINQWVHVTATYSNMNNLFSLYINGTLVSSQTIYGPLTGDSSSFTIGRHPDTNSNYFHGYIDEVRVFNKALTENEIKKMVYQEIYNNRGIIRGAIIPLNITDYVDSSTSTPLNWSYLQRYYKLDTYKDDIIDDLTTPDTDVDSGARIYNSKIITKQTAPLPYVTKVDCNGNWSDSSNWENGDFWDINSNTPDCAIVRVRGHLKTNSNQSNVGLIVDTDSSLKVNGDSGLFNSWYLKLDGTIDLEGESQLIQNEGSILDVTSSGRLERDQQGTKDLYTYNYWSSPVSVMSPSSNNKSYRLIDNILKNGTNASTPTEINFTQSTFDGSVSGSDITIADHWIWKYANKPNDTYSEWQQVRSYGLIHVGEGFTMKGVEHSESSYNSTQNYVFDGKPNNGNIRLPIGAGNDYLVGNPYPSALDANEFILDNIRDGAGRASSNIINGSLYFWDHFAVNSHILREYQGGYAAYSLMGSVVAISNDERIDATGKLGTKVPERYIPVAQGFYLIADQGGIITFKNSQRVFQKQSSGASVFIKSTSKVNKNIDDRQKIQLMFDSPNGYHRQLLVGADNNTTNNFDIGYDAPLIEDGKEDMYWIIDDRQMVIQAVNNFNHDQQLPLGIKTNGTGIINIKIDSLNNIDDDLDVFLHDKKLDTYHNLINGDYQTYLEKGTYNDRFEIVFSNTVLSKNDIETQDVLQVYYSKEKHSLIIHNPKSITVESIEIFTTLGQKLLSKSKNTNKKFIEENSLKQTMTGIYIVNINTENGVQSKKILMH
ncbi:LamG-like jellyroll fold domain-containing protein [Flavivirga eckloniae]|uniref:MAM domain-containing protein n=1 Tax=Flavivirga eckloniae TaxID=1803846 RepID=A0A2K9PLU3_9FLAO|nr:LamG-like jellyroll fold domain-containing protein [Flavivirga eckloniae]AUP78020.1 hypothetical protein C1H87_04550 [Flavivirga eckloniae]